MLNFKSTLGFPTTLNYGTRALTMPHSAANTFNKIIFTMLGTENGASDRGGKCFNPTSKSFILHFLWGKIQNPKKDNSHPNFANYFFFMLFSVQKKKIK